MNSDIRIHSIQSEFMNLTACSNLLLAVTVVTRRGPPGPAVTRRSPPCLNRRCPGSPWPVSLGLRRGPPMLAAARRTASVTRRRSGAKA